MDASRRERIVDTALQLAEASSWERVRLHAVAERLGLRLEDVRGHFREKEEIVEAWFDRADAAMLGAVRDADFAALPGHERFARVVLDWLGALAGHRRVTREMILGKLEPGHVHYQFAGLLRVSRTVQWMREAARLDAPLPWRAIEESVLTAIYLATFARWMCDDSPGAAHTARQLRDWLAGASRFAGPLRAAGASQRTEA